jgi:hypothetical protein
MALISIIPKQKFQVPRFFYNRLHQQVAKILKIFLVLYLVYDQIWLKYFVNDDQFGYKIGKK